METRAGTAPTSETMLAAAPSIDFLTGGGEVGSLMLAHDWATSPLGNPESWPQSLRSIVSFLLNSKFPMFLAWGDELGCIYNDAYISILGAKHPSALGKRSDDVWAEIWKDIQPLVARALSGEAVYQENLPLTVRRHESDEQAWFTFSYSPVRDESGYVKGMCCICIETTEAVLSERHRIEENDRLRHLFKQAPGIMAVIRGPKHVFDLVNDAYLQLIGYREIIGKPVRVALPEVGGQGLFELLDRVYATGEPFVGRAISVNLQRRPGAALEERFVDFVYQPIRDRQGMVSGIFVEGSDVTEGVRANNALRESEERLRQLANNLPHLAWMADPDGSVHWYNNRWYEYTGTTPEEMQGWGWQKVHDPKRLPGTLEHWKNCLATGERFEATFPLRSASGEFRTFFTLVAPLHDAAGKIVQWFGTNTDVTQSEAARAELAAASRRKDEFLAMLAHELRNPLAPVSTAAELLKLSNLDPERIRQTSDIISRQVGHMTELVDDLLDVSRVTRGLITLQNETHNLKRIISDAVEQVQPLIASKHQHFAVQVGDVEPVVNGDRTRLTQVFSNILNNAAKYTPEGGHITLRLNVLQEEIEVIVRDDGIGIAPTLLPYVFNLFAQAERTPDRSQGGLGLGLALVKSLVDLHGGSVLVRSHGLGKGSEFIVRLPRLAAAPQESHEHPDSDVQAAHNALRLAVVDDNVDAANTLSLLLEAIGGHKVSVAHDGERALELVRDHKPKILFVDIGLPGMDGYELARRLRALPETADSVLVAVTGYGQPSDKQRAMEAGFDHHMVKPVKLDAILDLLGAFGTPDRRKQA